MNTLITAAAFICAVLTVFVDRVLQPLFELLIQSIAHYLGTPAPQPLLAAAPVAVVDITPADVPAAKPRPARRRRSTAKAKAAVG